MRSSAASASTHQRHLGYFRAEAVGYQPSDTVRIRDLFQERGLEAAVIGVRLAYSREGVPVVAKIAGANL